MLTKKLSLITAAGLVVWLGATASGIVQDVQRVRGQEEIGVIPGENGNRWKSEPLLVYDVSGTTLLGHVHKSLTVYNNGRVSLAEYAPGIDPRNESRVIEVEAVERLHAMLIGQGALTLIDQEPLAMDVPLRSVTVFQGETDATCHTYNYWVPEGGFQAVQEAIDSFIATAFPEEE